MSGNWDTVTSFPFPEPSLRPISMVSSLQLFTPSYNYIFHDWALGELQPALQQIAPLQLKVDNNLNVYWLLQPSSR